MKATKWIAAVTGVVGILVVLYFFGPAVRTEVDQQAQTWMGWTDKARQADPVGFTEHVEGQLKEDLVKLESTRRALITEAGTLSRNMQQQQALLEQADKLAEEFRSAYQAAQEEGRFPLTLHNAAYTEEQILSQVSLLLAEADGYRSSLAKLEEIRRKADEKLEVLTVRIDSTRADLAAMGTKRELFRARVLTTEAEQLIAHVDQLLERNEQVVHGNPVRSVAELLAADNEQRADRPSIEVAREFLLAKPEIEKPAITVKEPVVEQEEAVVEPTISEPVSFSQHDNVEPSNRRVRITATYPVWIEPAGDDASPAVVPTRNAQRRKPERPAYQPIFVQS